MIKLDHSDEKYSQTILELHVWLKVHFNSNLIVLPKLLFVFKSDRKK